MNQKKRCFRRSVNVRYRIDLESQGVDVRRDEPSAGAMGMAALMASMGPIYGINSALTIATTIGSSADTLASDRLLQASLIIGHRS